MAGGVEEGDPLTVGQADLIGADMLGDAAGLAGRHVRLADRVEEGGLAMVHMPEDDHDRGPRLHVLGFVGYGLRLDLVLGLLLRRRVPAVLDIEDKSVLLGDLLRDGLVYRRIH